MPNKDRLIREWVSMFGDFPEEWRTELRSSKAADDTSAEEEPDYDRVTLADWLHETYFDDGKKVEFTEEHIGLFGELLQLIMQYRPSDRPSVSELLKHPRRDGRGCNCNGPTASRDPDRIECLRHLSSEICAFEVGKSFADEEELDPCIYAKVIYPWFLACRKRGEETTTDEPVLALALVLRTSCPLACFWMRKAQTQNALHQQYGLWEDRGRER
ncbi:MAG: hypothetical protein Q9171_005294 [Xanthocarpia ochracea]